MARLEKHLQSKMLRRINDLGCPSRARVVHGGPHQSAGEPDIDACLFGRTLKVEVKLPGNKPTERQDAVIRKWRDAGATAGWADSIEGLDRLIIECLREVDTYEANNLAQLLEDDLEPDDEGN